MSSEPTISNYERRQIEKQSRQRQTKVFIGEGSWMGNRTTATKEIETLVGLIPSNTEVNYHKHKTKKDASPVCRFGEVDEKIAWYWRT